MLLKIIKSFDIPQEDDLSKRNIYHLIFAYILISLPVLTIFPVWLPIVISLTILLKIFITFKDIKILRIIPFFIFVIGVALMVMNYRGLGREYVGVGMLCIFASLKLLETRKERDSFLLMLINMLLILSSLMSAQSFFLFIFLFLCFFYNIYIQIKIAQPTDIEISVKRNILTLLKMALISLPFVVLLFFFFPRFPPMWETPATPKPKMGLSDEMSPSSLGDLAQSPGMAFRVKFEGKVPAAPLQYWRGPVLSSFDGKTWRRSNTSQVLKNVTIYPNTKINYRITIDGATNKWVPVLDITGKAPKKDLRLFSNFQVKSKKDITGPTNFNFTAYTKYNTGEISQRELYESLKLPNNIYPQTRELAKSLKNKTSTNEEYINSLMSYLRAGKFIYDLNPPKGNDDIDTFLFKNKTGYCEHFSSSFVFLSRAGGVPARVVTGYQGGEFNDVSGEFEVRQLNAHAWAEVYLDGKGWVRYDPTATVSPNRVNGSNVLDSVKNTDNVSAVNRFRKSSAFFRKMTNYFSAANTFWQNWVLGFNEEKQNNFLEKLGLSSLKESLWLIVTIPTGLLIYLFIVFQRRYKKYKNLDNIQKSMKLFLKKATKLGLKKSNYQPFTDFISENKNILLEKQKYEKALSVVKIYNFLRFEKKTGRKTLEKELKKQVNNF